MKLFSAYIALIKRNRWWIFFVLVLAAVWTTAGYLSAVTYPEAVPTFFEALDRVFDEALEGTDPAPTSEFAWALLKQNSTAAGLNLLLGIGLGLVPLFSIVVNFFTLGFLAGSALGGVPGMASIGLGLFFTAIVPHGIFEIPALLLAAAFGFRIGWHWLLPASSGRRKQTLKESFRDALIALPLIAALLVIAALIEAFITFNLVN